MSTEISRDPSGSEHGPPAPAIGTPEWIDMLEMAMLGSGQVIDLPLVHRFTDGMYIREILLPAGTVATTKIHRTEHPFVILRGTVSVFIPGGSVEHFAAGHVGITRPGTRRVIYAHEDTVWITFHPNPDNERDLSVIESRLIERREIAEGVTANDIYKVEMALIYEVHEAIRNAMLSGENEPATGGMS